MLQNLELSLSITRFGLQRTIAVRPTFPNIIFDMDGTLVDTLGLITDAYNYVTSTHLPTRLQTDQVLMIPGRTLEDQLANCVAKNNLPIAVELYHEFFKQNFDARLRVFQGIRGLLFSLRRKGVKLAVCTGASRKTADYVLNRTRLLPFFELVRTADDVKKPKPDPEGLLAVTDLLHASPEQTVYIGDHPNDFRASRSAGVRSASALWESQLSSELEQLKPDFAFRHPSEVLRLSTWNVIDSTDDT
jgi:HAD superfamily hydrolase (TIGR01549 family)